MSTHEWTFLSATLYRDDGIIPENAGIVYQQKTDASSVYTDTMSNWFIIFKTQMLSLFLN